MSPLIDQLDRQLDVVKAASPFALPAEVQTLAGLIGALVRDHEARIDKLERTAVAFDVVM
jgi:hypothetical protein